jgi:PadR family transcriptional regulator PadR
MHHQHHGRGRRRGAARGRRRLGPNEWAVRSRVERFHEPVLLLLLREQPRHGYELIELLPAVAGGERVDVGNLYRFLRALEAEGVVTSEWSGDLPGPAKRTYTLTETGERLLDRWVEALRTTQEEISGLLDRYDTKGGE